MTLSGIDVRPIKLHDLVRMGSMRTDVLAPDQSLGRLGRRMADPLSALPVSRRVRKSFVATVEGRPVGLIDLVSDPQNHRWVISRIATSRSLTPDRVAERDAVWRELAIQAIRAAGAARAKRVHACVPEQCPAEDALEETGFSAYAQDTVLMAQRLPSERRTGVARKQESSDVWSIHQLYHSVTPRSVQYAEALTSNFWDHVLPGQSPARGYVIEDGFEIVAHCRVTAVSDRPVLHVMVQHDALKLLEPLVADVLADISRGHQGEVVLIVPDYLQEYLAPLRGLGFEQSGRQTRLVKYTVVPRRMHVRGLEELAREVPERAVAGTPSFYSIPGAAPANGTHPGRETHAHRDDNGFR